VRPGEVLFPLPMKSNCRLCEVLGCLSQCGGQIEPGRGNQYGGSAWESNPPWPALRGPPPILKTGEITGTQALPPLKIPPLAAVVKRLSVSERNELREIVLDLSLIPLQLIYGGLPSIPTLFAAPHDTPQLTLSRHATIILALVPPPDCPFVLPLPDRLPKSSLFAAARTGTIARQKSKKQGYERKNATRPRIAENS
jgi:hypothetical protein